MKINKGINNMATKFIVLVIADVSNWIISFTICPDNP